MEQKRSFAVLAFVRQTKHNRDGESSVYIRITINGKRSEISTKTTVRTDRWVPGKGRVKGTGLDTMQSNQGIIAFEHRAREIYNRFIEQGKIVTVGSVKNELLGLEHRQRMLLEQFRVTVGQMEARINNGFAAGTIKNWKVTQGHLEQFLKKYCLLDDICFKELTLKFVTDFEWYVRREWSCGKLN